MSPTRLTKVLVPVLVLDVVPVVVLAAAVGAAWEEVLKVAMLVPRDFAIAGP